MSFLCFIFLGVDNVGTVPAALITYASIQALHPDLVIDIGTAGGFKVWINLTCIYRYIAISVFVLYLDEMVMLKLHDKVSCV